MKNILYIDDYINLYSGKLNKIITVKPLNKTLKFGKIIDKEKFLRSFFKLKKENNLNNNLILEEITVIINSSYTKEDKKNILDILEQLNYKKIHLVNEVNLLKININNIFIIYNNSYFYLYYLNKLGNVEIKVYLNDLINKNIIITILQILNKKEIIISGKNYMELKIILDRYNYNYLFYEDNNNLFITMMLKNFV